VRERAEFIAAIFWKVGDAKVSVCNLAQGIGEREQGADRFADDDV